MSKYTLDVALVDESEIINNLHNRIYQLRNLLKPVMRELDRDGLPPEIASGNLVDEILIQTNRLDYLVYCTSDILDKLMIEHNEEDKLEGVGEETPITKSSNALETLDGALVYQKHKIDSLIVVVLKLEDRLKMLLLPREDKGDVSGMVARMVDSYVMIVEDNTQRLMLIDSMLASIIERLSLSNMDELEDTKR